LGAPPRCGKCVPMVADMHRDVLEQACAGGDDD
jgi:hypothetical protein